MIDLVAHRADGLILYFLRCLEENAAIQIPPEGGGIIALKSIPDPMTFAIENYVVDGVIKPRTPMGIVVSKTDLAADGVDEVTITGIPAGATVTIGGAVKAGPETITDGELVITSTSRGQITVSITLIPSYQDFGVTLNAT